MSAAASDSAGGGGGGGGGGGSGSDRPGGDRRQSFTKKFMNRAKSALRRDKRQSSSGDAPDMPSPTDLSGTTSPPQLPPPAQVSGFGTEITAEPEPEPEPELNPKPETKLEPETKPTTKPGGQPAEEKKKKEEDVVVAAAANVTSRAAIQYERVRALFEKYDYTLEPNEWPVPAPTEPVERVHKPIRMRVHRSCHRCQTTFGVDRVCAQCSHKRCKKCPRYPAKKAKHGPDQGKVAGITAGTAAAGGPETTQMGKLTSTSTTKYRFVIPAKTEQQDRVRKEIRMRVHRTCHKCFKEFTPHKRTCAGCSHVRCTKCPRYPAKLDKYPHGYPGDAQPDDESGPGPMIKPRAFKKVRMLVRYYCHQCESLFDRGNKSCPSCQHRRCDDCRRVPAKKIRLPVPPPDPDVVKSVEAKLAALHLRQQPWMSSSSTAMGGAGAGAGGGDVIDTATTTAGESENAGG